MRSGRARANSIVPPFTVCALSFLLLLLCLNGVEGRQSRAQSLGRSEAGARSPRNANYQIDVRLDHAARTLAGRETIGWRNISSNPTSELQFHLYWNAWRDLESTWLRERRLAPNFSAPRADAWSSVEVTHLRVRQGARFGETSPDWLDLRSRQVFIAPDDGNGADRTVMAMPLPFAVQPNDTIEIEVECCGWGSSRELRTGFCSSTSTSGCSTTSTPG